MLAVMGMPAAMKTARTVMAPTTALPRASGMKLYLHSTEVVTLQMWCAQKLVWHMQDSTVWAASMSAVVMH
jgi:hypothetical protein